MEPIAFILGVACIVLALWDAFETIVVPRPTSRRLRIGRILTRAGWRAWRFVAQRARRGLARDRLLGIFAPAAVIALLVAWLLMLVLGYGLVLFALQDQIRPVPADLGSALYFAGTLIVTLGFGDVVAVGPLARFIALVAATTGLGVVALVITYLFSLFASFQRREILVVTLDARAGAPASALTLLETYAELNLVADLPALFADWEHWSAEVLDSHVAYPILAYFRSSHDNESWISAIGAVLDAACLVTTTICNVSRGPAELMRRVGSHFVEDISYVVGLAGAEGSIVDRPSFEEAYLRLATAGYELEELEVAWHAFEAARAGYAARLEAMAGYWATTATMWIGAPAATGSPAHAPATETVGTTSGGAGTDNAGAEPTD